MPPPPSSNISRFAADIIVGSAEMPEDVSFSGSSGASGAAAAATASSAPAPFASAAIAFLNRASASETREPAPDPAAPFSPFLAPRPPNPRPPLALRAWRSSFAAASRERSAKTLASISPILSRITSSLFASNVPPPSSPET